MLSPDKARALKRLGDRMKGVAEERDRLILEAHQAGASSREIADKLPITHVQVWRIIKKAGEQ